MPLLRSLRPVALAAASLLAAAVLATPAHAKAAPHGPAKASKSQVKVVDLSEPQNLPTGGSLRAAYGDLGQQNLIHRPGRAPLRTGSHRGVGHLLRVRGGYTVTVLDRWVRFIGDDGRRRNLAHYRQHSFVDDVVASRDGRYVAIMVGTVDDRQVRVVVKRVSDAKVVARRLFSYPVIVASFTGSRAMLSTIGRAADGHRPDVLTRWWNLRTDRLRLVDDAGPIGRGTDYLRWPADLTAGQVALLRGDHDLVAPLGRHSGQAWRTSAHEWVLSWSPDDRYVLTSSVIQDPDVPPGVVALTIRRARTGAPVTRFQSGPSSRLDGDPVWEDQSTLVLYASYNCGGDPREGFGCKDHAVTRCTVHGTCRRVAVPAGTIYPVERRLPPS